MPRTMAPRISSPRAISACCATKGAAASTEGFCRAWRIKPATSAKPSPPGANSSMWATTASMRSRTSFWKPFITLNTMISAATPKAMPSMDTPEMNEMKPLRPLDRPARV